MLTMATEETRHYFQTLQRLKHQYTAWAASMRATDAYAGRSGHTSNDAIGNALFLWAREQDPEKLAELLEPYVDRFQKSWAERDGGNAEVAPKAEPQLKVGQTKSNRDLVEGYTAKKQEKSRRATSKKESSEKIPVGNDKKLKTDDVP